MSNKSGRPAVTERSIYFLAAPLFTLLYRGHKYRFKKERIVYLTMSDISKLFRSSWHQPADQIGDLWFLLALNACIQCKHKTVMQAVDGTSVGQYIETYLRNTVINPQMPNVNYGHQSFSGVPMHQGIDHSQLLLLCTPV